MNAPDHRGEPERWTLHRWKVPDGVLPRILTQCLDPVVGRNDCHYDDHVEVVPAAAMEQAVHETDQYWRDKMDSALDTERAEMRRLRDKVDEAQKNAANWIKLAEWTQKEFERLVGELKAMHRRAQTAEAAAMVTVEQCRASSPRINLRRALYAVAAQHERERAEAAEAKIAEMREVVEAAKPHAHCPGGGALADALAALEGGK